MTHLTAADFLRFDHALRMHEVLGRDGFCLRPRARAYRHCGFLTVHLVWRHESTRDSVRLALRVRLLS